MYDPLGRRIEVRLRDGNIRRYYYDGHDLLAAYDESNNFLVAGVYGPGIDQAVSIFRNGENYYYHADALGSIYQMTDSAENVVKNYDYSAFGKIISESGSLPFDNPITYTGREYDDSGLYYYRARYYDADVGRFLSRDSISLANLLGLSSWRELLSLYSYVLNNPENLLDPFGLYIVPPKPPYPPCPDSPSKCYLDTTGLLSCLLRTIGIGAPLYIGCVLGILSQIPSLGLNPLPWLVIISACGGSMALVGMCLMQSWKCPG
jgi:RHS repeat-associated protein